MCARERGLLPPCFYAWECVFSLRLHRAPCVPVRPLFERSSFGRCPRPHTRCLQILPAPVSFHLQSLPAVQPGSVFLSSEPPTVISSPCLPLMKYSKTDMYLNVNANKSCSLCAVWVHVLFFLTSVAPRNAVTEWSLRRNKDLSTLLKFELNWEKSQFDHNWFLKVFFFSWILECLKKGSDARLFEVVEWKRIRLSAVQFKILLYVKVNTRLGSRLTDDVSGNWGNVFESDMTQEVFTATSSPPQHKMHFVS